MSEKKNSKSITPSEIVTSSNLNNNCLTNSDTKKRRDALTALISLLPQATRKNLNPLLQRWIAENSTVEGLDNSSPAVASQAELELCSEIRRSLNEATVQGSLGRRDFLKIAGLLMTSGLGAIIFPQAAEAMYNMGAFWKKKQASGLASSGYPANTGSDPYWDYVVLLMNMDTPTPSTGFTSVFADESNNVGKAVTTMGSAHIHTSANSSPYSGRVGSGSLNGSSDYLTLASSTDFDFSADDFTFEAWVKTSAAGTLQTVVGRLPVESGYAANYFIFGLNEVGRAHLSVRVNDVDTSLTGTTSINTDTWTHIAVVRQSTTVKLYVNGVLEGTPYTLNSFPANCGTIRIGRFNTQFNHAFVGLLSDLRIYKGVAKYTSNFTPRTTPIGLGTANDKYWGYCVLACPFENSLKDMSGKRISGGGSVALNSTTKKFGAASLELNGTSQHLAAIDSSDWSFGTNNFTVEAWVNFSSTTGSYRAIVSQWAPGTAANCSFSLGLSNGTTLGAYGYSGTTQLSCTTSWSPSTGVWYHVAACRSNGIMYLFVDGTLKTSGHFALSLNDCPNGLTIGTEQSVNYFSGHIDSLRITKGFARYTANFTPPTASFPVGKDESVDPFWSYTVLAMRMDDLSDSTARNAPANNGSIANSASVYRYGTGSLSLNGTSQYLSLTQTILGAEDFTVEAWVYLTQNTAAATLYSQYDASSARTMFDLRNLKPTIFQGGPVWNNATIPLNVWTHLAFVRTGSTCESYINGMLNATCTTFATPAQVGSWIGAYNNSGTPAGFFPGYIDDLRITKGIARYVQNFTPPTREFATTQYNPYSATLVTSGLVCRLDAGESASYDGSSQTWSNLVASPADGAAKTAYDFHRGSSSSSESSDPTFMGVSGGRSANDFFSFDGGDYFSLAGGANTTFINSLHQDNTQFTLIVVAHVANNAAWNNWICTFATGGHYGIAFQMNNSGKLHFSAYNSTSSLTRSSDLTLSTGLHMAAISLNEAGVGFFYLDGAYAQVSSSNTWSASYSNPTTNNATYAMKIGADGVIAQPLPNGSKLYSFMMYNRALSKAELDQNFNATRSRFGL